MVHCELMFSENCLAVKLNFFKRVYLRFNRFVYTFKENGFRFFRIIEANLPNLA